MKTVPLERGFTFTLYSGDAATTYEIQHFRYKGQEESLAERAFTKSAQAESCPT